MLALVAEISKNDLGVKESILHTQKRMTPGKSIRNKLRSDPGAQASHIAIYTGRLTNHITHASNLLYRHVASMTLHALSNLEKDRMQDSGRPQ